MFGDRSESYAQLDDGSEVSCILMEHVHALGLEGQMVLRKHSKQCRVRGIGQQAGTGQIIKYDICLSMKVRGREVLDWEITHMAPVSGEELNMHVEGWFSVLEEMSVPILVGGDVMRGDVIHRAANQLVVIQNKEKPLERVTVHMYTMGTLIVEVGEIQDDLQRTSVWHEMARNWGLADPERLREYSVNRARVPPRSMRAVKVRYNGHGALKEGELFSVVLIKSSLRAEEQGHVRAKLAYVVGWDPRAGLVCSGHPTVMAYNLPPEPLEVRPDDIKVMVCPMHQVTRYCSQAEAARRQAKGGLSGKSKTSSSVVKVANFSGG